MFLKFRPPTLSEGFNNIYTIESQYWRSAKSTGE
jgi:hypothetical protein